MSITFSNEDGTSSTEFNELEDTEHVVTEYEVVELKKRVDSNVDKLDMLLSSLETVSERLKILFANGL
jgi:hypothetical protein